MPFIDRSLPTGDRDDDEILDDPLLFENSPIVEDEKKEVKPEPPKHKNLIVKKVVKNYQKGIVVDMVGIPIPRAFDFDYYSNKIDEYKSKGANSQAFKMSAFKKYAGMVYEFYRQVIYLFNKKHDVINNEFLSYFEDSVRLAGECLWKKNSWEKKKD